MELSYFNRRESKVPMGKMSLDNLVQIIREPDLGGILFEKAAVSIQAIRSSNNESEQQDLKSKLPCITPGALFGNSRQDVLSLTGLMVIDVDHVDNPNKLKRHLSKQKWVTLAALSVRQNVWAIVRIPEPERQHEYWEKVNLWLLSQGLPEADPARKNPKDLRYYSPDPECYYNPNAVSWKKLSPGLQVLPEISSTGKIGFSYSPLDDFNKHGDVITLLLSRGWKISSQKSTKTNLTRPGKNFGISADYDMASRKLYVFSSNSILTPCKALSPVDVFLELHQITINEAYSKLKEMGYGGYKSRTKAHASP